MDNMMWLFGVAFIGWCAYRAVFNYFVLAHMGMIPTPESPPISPAEVAPDPVAPVAQPRADWAGIGRGLLVWVLILVVMKFAF
jgi:hypothetical protein